MKVRKLTPKGPDWDRLDPAGFDLFYDNELDTMFLYLADDDIAPVSVLLDPEDDIYALVDPSTEEVIGLRIERFLEENILKNPTFIHLGVFAGIDPSRMFARFEELLRDLPADEQENTKRQSFKDSLMDQLRDLFGPAGNRKSMAPA